MGPERSGDMMTDHPSEHRPPVSVVYTTTCDGEKYHVLRVTREVVSTHPTFTEAMDAREAADYEEQFGREAQP